MGLSDGRKSFRIGLAVLIQYRSVAATQPASHVAVAITLNAKASSLKTELIGLLGTDVIVAESASSFSSINFLAITITGLLTATVTGKSVNSNFKKN